MAISQRMRYLLRSVREVSHVQGRFARPSWGAKQPEKTGQVPLKLARHGS